MQEIDVTIDNSPVKFWDKILALDSDTTNQVLGQFQQLGNALFDLSNANRARELSALDAKRKSLQDRIRKLKSSKQSIADEQLPFDQLSVPIVTNESTQENKIALFRSLFRGREDVYPRRFESKDAKCIR